MDNKKLDTSKRLHKSGSGDGEYEQVNFGSDERNQKFLRLMGGTKNSSHGNVPHANPVKPHAIEEYQPHETREEGNKEECHQGEEEEDEIQLNIHSANKWESAQLGDTGRKNKFLRLMGAARQSSDTSSEQDTTQPPSNERERKGFNPDQLAKDLEQQYERGIEFRRSGGVRKHRGFGFVPEPPAQKEPEGDVKSPQESDQVRQGAESYRSEHDDRDRNQYERDHDRDRRAHREEDDIRRGDRGASRWGLDDYRPNHDALRHGKDDCRRERTRSRWDLDDDKADHDDHRHKNRDDFRRNRDDDRRDKREYKTDPSEYGRVARDNRLQSHDQQGYGSAGHYGNPTQQSGGHPQVVPQTQWSNLGQTATQAYDWRQPPPPPPPEPCQQSYQPLPNYYGSQQVGCGGQSTCTYSAQTGCSTQSAHGRYGGAGNQQPPSQSQEPPQPAHRKYPKPMAFVKSSDT